MDFYWYISADKVNMLAGPASVWRTLSLKLKWKFLELETTANFDADLLRRVEKIRDRLENDNEVVPFENLDAGGAGAIFSFSGEASRTFTDEAFWVATSRANSALLLVGAPGNATGVKSDDKTFISPSKDPLRAVKAVVAGGGFDDIGSSLSYSWHEVIRTGQSGDAHLPMVDGLAVFAGSFKADKAQMRRVGKSEIDTIVLGSPIYVRQTGR
jgi:hypothetical protein